MNPIEEILPLASEWIGSNNSNEDDSEYTLLLCNVGDSRGVVFLQDKFFAATVDHKPNDPNERARVEAIGGYIKVQGNGICRVNGFLSVSRVIGQRFESPFVSNEPDFYRVRLPKDQKVRVVLATDGLWDVLSIKDVATRDAGALVDAALWNESKDNIAVIVIESKKNDDDDDDDDDDEK